MPRMPSLSIQDMVEWGWGESCGQVDAAALYDLLIVCEVRVVNHVYFFPVAFQHNEILNFLVHSYHPKMFESYPFLPRGWKEMGYCFSCIIKVLSAYMYAAEECVDNIYCYYANAFLCNKHIISKAELSSLKWKMESQVW